MTGVSDPEAAVDPAEAALRADWLARLDAAGEDAGYLQTLGARHWAFFSDEGTTLLVTFESAEDIREGSEEGLPAGLAHAARHGWSHLCLIAEGATWYRDPAVYAYFDRLVDDAFFEDFDRVVFFGAGMGGYAAAAFSVAAPGCTVVAVQPVATLDPAQTVWDTRHRRHRRLNFTDRYGYAPDMIDGAGEVFVLYDPAEPLDAMHAALFRKPFVRPLRVRMGGQLGQALPGAGMLAPMLDAAGQGRLTPALFRTLYRKRREFGPYLRLLHGRVAARGRPLLEAILCRNILSRMAAPRFRRRLTELEEQFAREGRSLPPPILR